MFHRCRLLSVTVLPALLIASAHPLPASIWNVSVFQGPTPSSEDGPPLSAGALRDPSYLPIQIGSIVGAYLFCVVVLGVALVLVGRRLRRAAQASPKTLAMELVKPFRAGHAKAFDPSPISPLKHDPYGPSPVSTIDMKGTWPSPEKRKSSTAWSSIGRGHQKQTSMQSSVVTFDESVIEDDKTKNQKELDRLYEAVMEHDEYKSTSRLDLTDGQSLQSPQELQHLRSGAGTNQSSSVPPPSNTASPARTVTASPRKQSKPSPITTLSRASSRSSMGSFGKKRGIRNLAISSPMGSPDLRPEHVSMYGESEPLSPRFYEPGPPPPTPPLWQPAKIAEDHYDASRLSPRHAAFPDFGRAPRTAAPTTQTFPESAPRPKLQSTRSDNSIPLRDLTKPKRAPPPLALQTRTLAGAGADARQLPLRSAPLPLRNLKAGAADAPRPRP